MTGSSWRWCRAGRRRWQADRAPGRCCALLALALLLATGVDGATAAPSPQRAIEQLERCSAEEVRQGCVRILRQERVDENTVRIKAEIRGGRIILYQLDLRSGAIRRVN